MTDRMRRAARAFAALSALLISHCGGDQGMQSHPAGAAGAAAAAGAMPAGGTGEGGAAGMTAAGSGAPAGAGGVAGSGAAGQTGGAPAAGTGGVAGSAAAGASGQSAAGDGGSSGAGDAGSGAGGAPDGPTFPPVDDLAGDGPYTPETQTGSGPGGGYTVFHPRELGENGVKHPFLTWGNGATTTPGLFALLPHLASHGFVVIASDNPFVTGEEMRAGIDWLFAENERAGSMFHQKLDTANVASMGYSLGSLGTFEIADDPRFVTTVHISGGAMDKSVLSNLKNPAAFFCGDPSDIAHENCESDFELATVPVFYGVFPGGHLGILSSHAEPIAEVVTGWLRWRLMRDGTLESMFVGAGCTLCSDPGWTIKQKDFDVAP